MGSDGRLALCLVLSAVHQLGHGHINECVEFSRPPPCGSGQRCVNTAGGFRCQCIAGYRQLPPPAGTPPNATPPLTCVDINECVEFSRPPPCGSGQRCVNTAGGFRCQCIAGYRQLPPPAGTPPNATPPLTCVDVDECADGGGRCGGGAVCLNTPGSFECHCPPGTRKGSHGECSRVTEPPPPLLPPHLCLSNQSRCELTQNLSQMWAELEGGGDPRHVLQALLALLDAALAKVSGDGSAPQRHLRVTALLSAAESIVRAAALRMRDHSGDDVFISAGGTELRLALPPAPPGPPVRLQHPEVGLEVPREVAGGGDNALVALLVQPRLREALGGARGVQWKKGWGGPPRTEAGGRLAFRLLTPIGTAIVGDPPGGGNVTLSFRHPEPDPRLQGRTLCAFWDPEAQLWGTGGCDGGTATPPAPPGTVCTCSHLTSFVVLLAFYEPEENWALDVVTKAGLLVSVLCLLLAIVTFLVCRVPKGLRRVLHLHLSIALLLAHGTFLLGIDSTHNPTLCAVVAGLLHFSFLAAFTWMCLEGLHLYVLLVRVFEPSWLRVWHALVSGYGLPAILVLCSAIVFPGGYGTMQYCWLTLDRGFRWSFQAPVCLIVAVNAVILIITIWKLVQKFDDINPDLGHLRKMRALAGTCAAQLCLLGTGWALGLPQPRFGPPPPALSFLFCAINAAQGLFILIFHCLANPQVRDAYRRCLCPTSCRYTEFSTSATSATSSSRVHQQRS